MCVDHAIKDEKVLNLIPGYHIARSVIAYPISNKIFLSFLMQYDIEYMEQSG